RDGEGNLTTVYSENQYSNAIIVNFNTDGVEGIENIVLVKQGKVTAPAAPEKEYYIFDGWFADEELTIPFDFNQIITKDTIIYAKWVENLPTISAATFTFGDAKFSGSGSSQDGNKTMTVTGGGTLAVEISSSTAYWDGSATNSLRLGSSKNTGSITFEFDSSVKITKVTVYASQYDGAVSLNVDDGEAQKITNASGTDYIGYEFVLNNLSSFTISSVKTSQSRLQVQKIVIEYAPQA
ncbi:MAG TPA: InlB B-repeat-containing protein, partial [Acholeplasma sp.]|nr:InlB B-repeat-containing protein [Acholeplasma sp.]